MSVMMSLSKYKYKYKYKYLVEINDVLILHLSEDVDLLLDVAHRNAPPRRLHPFLLDVPLIEANNTRKNNDQK